jgi:hypothetical protein
MKLNLLHSSVATDNLTQIILQLIIGIAFVQKPNPILNKVVGFPKGFKIHACDRGRIRSAIITN